VNETLCVLRNNFSKMPKSTLVSTLSEFYTEEEISEAKRIAMEFADELSPKADELKKIKARVGDGKLRRDVEDIIQIYAILDARQAKLPRFFAADTSRIPTFRDVEICTVTASISDLSIKMEETNSTINKVSAMTANIGDLSTKVEEILKVINMRPTAASLGASVSSASGYLSPSASVSADSAGAASVADNDEGDRPWSQIVAKQRRTSTTAPLPTVRKVVGTRPVDTTSKLAAAPAGPKLWHVFVGRAHKDAEDKDIKEHLESKGITVSEVRKLKPTQEWQEKSSAFRVSVLYTCKDDVMSPDMWPENVQVRDWHFKPK